MPTRFQESAMIVTECVPLTNNRKKYMDANETELRALMKASLCGDEDARRTLLSRLQLPGSG